MEIIRVLEYDGLKGVLNLAQRKYGSRIGVRVWVVGLTYDDSDQTESRCNVEFLRMTVQNRQYSQE